MSGPSGPPPCSVVDVSSDTSEVRPETRWLLPAASSSRGPSRVRVSPHLSHLPPFICDWHALLSSPSSRVSSPASAAPSRLFRTLCALVGCLGNLLGRHIFISSRGAANATPGCPVPGVLAPPPLPTPDALGSPDSCPHWVCDVRVPQTSAGALAADHRHTASTSTSSPPVVCADSGVPRSARTSRLSWTRACSPSSTCPPWGASPWPHRRAPLPRPRLVHSQLAVASPSQLQIRDCCHFWLVNGWRQPTVHFLEGPAAPHPAPLAQRRALGALATTTTPKPARLDRETVQCGASSSTRKALAPSLSISILGMSAADVYELPDRERALWASAVLGR